MDNLFSHTPLLITLSIGFLFIFLFVIYKVGRIIEKLDKKSKKYIGHEGLDLNNTDHIEKLKRLKNLRVIRLRRIVRYGCAFGAHRQKEIPLYSAVPNHSSNWTDIIDSLHIVGETKWHFRKSYFINYFSKELAQELEEKINSINEEN